MSNRVVLSGYNPVTNDADVMNWYRRAGGNVSTGRLSTVTTLVTGLKSDGVWTKLDRLWLLAAENQTSALADLKGGTLATIVGSPTFTTDRGYTGSTSNYLSTTFNPSTAGGNISQNSAHIGAWVVTLGTASAVGTVGGVELTLYYLSPNWRALLNDSTFLDNSAITTGHVVGVRSGASATANYANGGSKTTGSAASVALVTGTFTIGAETTGSNPGTHQVGAAHIGGALTDTDVSNFYTRLRTYMTAVGVP